MSLEARNEDAVLPGLAYKATPRTEVPHYRIRVHCLLLYRTRRRLEVLRPSAGVVSAFAFASTWVVQIACSTVAQRLFEPKGGVYGFYKTWNGVLIRIRKKFDVLTGFHFHFGPLSFLLSFFPFFPFFPSFPFQHEFRFFSSWEG